MTRLICWQIDYFGKSKRKYGGMLAIVRKKNEVFSEEYTRIKAEIIEILRRKAKSR